MRTLEVTNRLLKVVPIFNFLVLFLLSGEIVLIHPYHVALSVNKIIHCIVNRRKNLTAMFYTIYILLLR